MASPTTGPCEPWTTDEEVRRCCVGLDPAYDLTEAIWWASVILWRKTGRRFHGLCERTVYPCKGDNCGCCTGPNFAGNSSADWAWAFGGYGVPGFGGPVGAYAYPIPGGFANVGLCDRTCKLPCVEVPGPISGVTEIVVNGEVLDPGFYKVKAFGEICRVDGGSWPCSNDLTCLPQPTIVTLTVDASGGTYDLAVTAGGTTELAAAIPWDATAAALEAILEALPNVGVGNVVVAGGPGDLGGTTPYTIEFPGVLGPVLPEVTADALTGGAATATKLVQQLGCDGAGSWQISYLFGRDIPIDARYMASILACQVALNRCGAEGCNLPQRLKEITRQGVSMAFADPLDFLDKGETGIYEIDLWLRDLNPSKIQRRASVHRADAPKNTTTFT
jgi:hypothetical protein